MKNSMNVTQNGALVKQLKPAHLPIIIISVDMSVFRMKAVMIHEAQ